MTAASGLRAAGGAAIAWLRRPVVVSLGLPALLALAGSMPLAAQEHRHPSASTAPEGHRHPTPQAAPQAAPEAVPGGLVGRLVDATCLARRMAGPHGPDAADCDRNYVEQGGPAGLLPEGKDPADMLYLLGDSTGLAAYVGRTVRIEGETHPQLHAMEVSRLYVREGGGWREVPLEGQERDATTASEPGDEGGAGQPTHGKGHEHGSAEPSGSARHAGHGAPAEPGQPQPEEPLGIPMERHASGTSWQPDSTPMHALHLMRAGWMLMAHENVFAGYDHQGSDRGRVDFVAPNWLMLMESRPVRGGSLVLRQMLSLDPLTVTRRGYPLLLQSGESFRGEPLHDTQHPHDLFMELGASYTRPLTGSLGLEVYAAPVGEPALGPPAFPHRRSASSDPLAPLGHHWQDSTHISFGVLTAGLLTRKVKLEGSWFNGREPDDRRFDFDFRKLDSYSGRLSLNPTPSLSLQVSYGFLDSPEELEPRVSVRRLTASASYDRSLDSGGSWATTAVFGRNDPDAGPATASWLVESDLDLDGRNILFGRAEYVRKTGHDLALGASLGDQAFGIGSVVGGYAFRLRPVGPFVPALGVRASVNLVGRDLEPFYGTRAPAGIMLFLQVHPARMKAHGMEGHR